MCCTQVRTGPAGFVGYDYPAVYDTADRFGIVFSRRDFARFQLTEGWRLDAQRREHRRMEEDMRQR